MCTVSITSQKLIGKPTFNVTVATTVAWKGNMKTSQQPTIIRAFRKLVPLRLGLLILCTTALVYAGNPWFSSYTSDGQTKPVSGVAGQRAHDPLLLAHLGLTGPPVIVKGIASGGMIDLVISIHRDVPGDNDGNHQGGAGNEEQDKYEEIVQHFADAIYEATEGAQKVRNVRLYKKGQYMDKADVRWLAREWPHVPYKGGIGVKGGHVVMCDVFAATHSEHNMLSELSTAGYTLGHEYGHYFYGLYDEYKLAADDVPVVPSIMHSQWNARNGNYEWLNFSIAHQTNNPRGRFVNTLTNQQHRVFGKSAWETLVQPSANDPTNLLLGPRIVYAELATVAPTGTNTPVINLPGTARSALNIVWMEDMLMIVIVIDRSGSMYGEPMEAAKAAAQALVDLIDTNNYIAVVDFDDVVTTLVPMTFVETEADKAAIKAAIASLDARGMTAIWNAAQRGLDLILASGMTNLTRAVFLLTDGQDNSSTISPGTVLANYQNAQVPLLGFGYGSAVDASLPFVAQGSGGNYYSSPNNLEVAVAFHDAQGTIASRLMLAEGALMIPAGSRRRFKIPFLVDPNIVSLSALVYAENGASNLAVCTLRGPRGQRPQPSIETSGNDVLFRFTLANPAPGKWKLTGTANGLIRYGIDAQATSNAPIMHAWTETDNNNNNLRIVAQLQGARPLIGANVNALFETPDGFLLPFTLTPTGPGVYEALLSAFAQNGTYRVHITANGFRMRVRETYAGGSMALPPDTDDTQVAVPSDKPLPFSFMRAAGMDYICPVQRDYPSGTVSNPRPVFATATLARGVGMYTFEIQQNDVTIIRGRSSIPYFVPKSPLPLGAYRWRVSFVTKNMDAPITSAWVDFTRVPALPGVCLPLAPSGSVKEGKLWYAWSGDPLAIAYTIRIESSTDGSNFTPWRIVRVTQKKTGLPCDAYISGHKPGLTYRWTVQPAGIDGTGPLSLPQHFTYSE